MRFRTLIAAAALLAACSPPARNKAPEPPPAESVACNDLVPDTARQVRTDEETLAMAAVADLHGGPIAPGIYDLVRATRGEGANGWGGTRAVSINVYEEPSGATVVNWASQPQRGAAERWTATLMEAPTPTLTFTCGRSGISDFAFSVALNALQLRLPDGNGAMLLEFEHRS